MALVRSQPWTVRRVFRVAVTALFATTITAIVGGWITALAQSLGLFDHPEQQAILAMSWLGALLGEQYAQWLLFGLGGLTLGTWVDALLAKRERRPLLATAAIDRPEIVRRARQASQGISRLAAEYAEKPLTHPDYQQVDADMRAYRSNMEQYRRDQHQREEKIAARFQSDWAAECWEIIELAERYIQLNDQELFEMRTVQLVGVYQLTTVAALMARIAARLDTMDVVEE